MAARVIVMTPTECRPLAVHPPGLGSMQLSSRQASCADKMRGMRPQLPQYSLNGRIHACAINLYDLIQQPDTPFGLLGFGIIGEECLIDIWKHNKREFGSIMHMKVPQNRKRGPETDRKRRPALGM